MPHALASLAFDPADPKAAFAQLPQAQAVFALYGADPRAEPYIGRTYNLRTRLDRLLQPSPRHPRRLHLAGMVREIRWQLTGSEFESLLVQFNLLQSQYGTKCIERMHLRAPAFVRFLGSNPYPRVTVTHRPSLREADWAYGPFASRAAAERFSEEVLKLFLLRRCTDDLAPDPSHPGCVYSEMKMCLAPCYKGCTDERYAEEAAAVQEFLSTRGESRLVPLRDQRDQASADLAFESAAALHAQVERVESVRALAPELVRPLSQLRAVILQASANSDEVAVFLFENGRLRGPSAFSTLGMRIQNEQSGSTSLFAQPVAVEPIPEKLHTGDRAQDDEKATADPSTAPLAKSANGFAQDDNRDAALQESTAAKGTLAVPRLPRGLLESRLEAVLAELAASATPPSATVRQGHLALLKRWYYRPEAKRTGEICFPNSEGHWPIKSILRSIGRVAAKSIKADQRS
ncbi:MAG: excinuclease ABC subunit C [Terracidiphilus sp.]